MRYLIFLLLPLLSFGQIRSDQAAFRIGNTYVGLNKGGSISVVRPTPIVDVVESELYVTANALSRTNEADATTGLDLVGVTLASIESTPSPQNGTSLIEITSTDQNSDRFEVALNLTSGVQYDIKYWAWEASGGNGRTTSWVGFSDFTAFDWTETPTEYTQRLTTSSVTQTLRFYNFSTAKAYVDGLSIKQVDANDPPPGGSIPEITLTTKYAFPGAFGAARNTTGGRGGSYYAVTNTNNSGSGSFREAIATGSRIIIPQVEGIVDLTSNITGESATGNNITIWGQFAPGNGLTISDYYTRIQAGSNWIVRFMTFQNKKSRADGGLGSLMFRDAVSGGQYYVDHTSIRYSGDQSLDFILRFSNNKVTAAYNVIAEADPNHNTGSITGDSGSAESPVGESTFARTFFYNVSHRFPNMSGTVGDYEVYNVWATNYKSRIAVFEGTLTLDWLNNRFEQGGVAANAFPLMKMIYGSSFNPSIFSSGNYVTGWDETPSANQQNLFVYRFTTGQTDGSTTVTVNEQIDASNFTGTRQNNFGDPVDGIWDEADLRTNLQKSAGHNRGINSDGTPGFFRDDKDTDYFTKALAGNTESAYRIPSAWDDSSMTGEEMYDESDGDFMPDWFENANFDQPAGAEVGLNSASAADRDQVIVNWDFGDYTVVNNAGYTNLEMCAAYYAGDFETILDGTNDLNITIE